MHRSRVAQLAFGAAKLAFVVLPALVVFSVVRGWLLATVGNAAFISFTAVLVPGFMAAAVFVTCAGMVSGSSSSTERGLRSRPSGSPRT